MTIQQAINVMEKYTDTDSDSGVSKVVIEAHKMAIEALQNDFEWIPVTERLPETGPDVYEYVMVCMENGYVTTTGYVKDEGFDLWDESGDVIAWKPLPEPYQPCCKYCGQRLGQNQLEVEYENSL